MHCSHGSAYSPSPPSQLSKEFKEKQIYITLNRHVKQHVSTVVSKRYEAPIHRDYQNDAVLHLCLPVETAYFIKTGLTEISCHSVDSQLNFGLNVLFFFKYHISTAHILAVIKKATAKRPCVEIHKS